MVHTRLKSKLTEADPAADPSSSSEQENFPELLKHVGNLRDQSQRVIKDLVERGDPFEIYDGLNAANQRKLFAALWKDHERLRKIEETHKDIIGGYSGDYEGFGKYDEGTVYYYSDDSYDTPEEDKSPGHVSKKREIAEKRYVEDKKTGKIDVFADGYMVKGYFRERWLYNSSKAKDVPPKERPGKITEWHSLKLFTSPGDSELVAIPRHSDIPESYVSSPIFDTISSQLLLYRLTAIFGMPPATDYMDGFKQVWTTTFYWKDDKSSTIEFEDMKGSAFVRFEGSEDASKSALKLIEFLQSDNVPHPYGSVLAGTGA
ncbi:hypothetical protein UCREL1_4371 [Eutypa lata UCREL1]|uniref:Uncharacterized protein n=1 Tax=Eutypa lata (strain UCR-EL1) TaxID=1287681 RepID=M7SVV2_EUTLA|nr:hypothetical protein UCREL1_4371 [Eutypa lata UCREL1]